MDRPDYSRPTLAWIKRRARRLQAFYGVGRRIAIWDAWTDYARFTGAAALQLVERGRNG
ncbi:hypothetical protein ACFX58_03590 [Sphingomonas sp. NCPPB 2930]